MRKNILKNSDVTAKWFRVYVILTSATCVHTHTNASSVILERCWTSRALMWHLMLLWQGLFWSPCRFAPWVQPTASFHSKKDTRSTLSTISLGWQDSICHNLEFLSLVFILILNLLISPSVYWRIFGNVIKLIKAQSGKQGIVHIILFKSWNLFQTVPNCSIYTFYEFEDLRKCN